MTTIQRILFFFVLPIIAPLLFPPSVLAGGFLGILAEVILFVVLGFFLLRGRLTALTLLIFIQGLNAIIRIIMFFPHTTYVDGSPNFIYMAASLISIALSIYLVLRLDKVDVRTQMIK
jgi:uncharacterized membrane protein HdeD (DUF308 family)